MKKSSSCAICGDVIQGYGNDPWPIKVDGVCCDACNIGIVLPARIKMEEEHNGNV